MILAVLHIAILTAASYVAITKHSVGIVSRVSFGVGGIRQLLLLLIFMHIFDPLLGLLCHEPLL